MNHDADSRCRCMLEVQDSIPALDILAHAYAGFAYTQIRTDTSTQMIFAQHSYSGFTQIIYAVITHHTQSLRK